MKKVLRIAIIMALLVAPMVNAIVPGVNYDMPGGGARKDGYSQQVSAISGVISAGGVAISVTQPEVVPSSTSVFQLGAFASGPDLASALVADTFTWTVSASGCTAGTATQQDLASVTTDTSTYTVPMTMTSSQCHGTIHFQQAVGPTPVTIANTYLVFNVMAAPTSLTNSVTMVSSCSTAAIQADPNACRVDNNLLASTGLNNNPTTGWWMQLIMWTLIFWYIIRNRNLFMLVFAIGGVWLLVNTNWAFDLNKSLPFIALGLAIDIIIKSLNARKREREAKGV